VKNHSVLKHISAEKVHVGGIPRFVILVCFNTRIQRVRKYSMEIIVHNHFTLASTVDTFKQYSTPVWEIEIQSNLLNSAEFEAALRCDDNFTVSECHNSSLRSRFKGSGIVADFLAAPQKDFLLDLVTKSPVFRHRYTMPFDHYQSRTYWFADVLKDQAGFEMMPHIDNSHIVVQMVVNLLQDNNTSTEFYQFNESEPCYCAPLKRNHGVIFLNTPGAIHRIANVDQTRWILYCGLVM
jgi:hypothetical protein